jgi:hypothetical protein
MPSVEDIFLSTFSVSRNFAWEGSQIVGLNRELVQALPTIDLRQLDMNTIVQDVPSLPSAHVSGFFGWLCSTTTLPATWISQSSNYQPNARQLASSQAAMGYDNILNRSSKKSLLHPELNP